MSKFIRKMPDGKGGFKYIYKESDQRIRKVKTKNQTKTKEFENWFGNSKVVDKTGNPLVVFHGTDKDFSEFSKEKMNTIERKGDYVGEGFFFAKEKIKAARYAEQASKKSGVKNQQILDVYLKIEKPLIINSQEDSEKLRESFGGDIEYFTTMKKDPGIIKKELQKRGYDGLIDNLYNQYAVFEPTQIKSAKSNKGTFDPESANMNKAKRLKRIIKKWMLKDMQ